MDSFSIRFRAALFGPSVGSGLSGQNLDKSSKGRTSAGSNGPKSSSGGLLTVTALGIALGTTQRLCERYNAAAAAAAAALASSLLQEQWLLSRSLPFAAITVSGFDLPASQPPAIAVEPVTGLEFPTESEGKSLTGLGIRNKSLFGLKSIRIYAYGVYASPQSLHDKLAPKYASIPSEALVSNDYFYEDAIGEDIELSVKLIIFYKGLKIGQVRNAFEDSLGSRIKKFNKGIENPPLLESFTKQFKDNFKLERGTVINITRQPGYVLHTEIDGTHVGSVKSALLCQAFFDLYIGQNSFDKRAKEEIGQTFAKLVSHKPEI